MKICPIYPFYMLEKDKHCRKTHIYSCPPDMKFCRNRRAISKHLNPIYHVSLIINTLAAFFILYKHNHTYLTKNLMTIFFKYFFSLENVFFFKLEMFSIKILNSKIPGQIFLQIHKKKNKF